MKLLGFSPAASSRSLPAFGVVSVLLLGALLGGCAAATVGEESSKTVPPGAPEGVDCSACADRELCWYTLNEEGKLREFGCTNFPRDCIADPTCDCVNESLEKTCDDYVQNSNACSVIDGVQVLECISTLG
jgi:hypothetical protein